MSPGYYRRAKQVDHPRLRPCLCPYRVLISHAEDAAPVNRDRRRDRPQSITGNDAGVGENALCH
jgi:hypothetical protein